MGKSFRDEWPRLQVALDRVIAHIEGRDNSSFTSDEYISYYTITYELCVGFEGQKNSKMLYDQYNKVFDEYINSTVLPSLRVKEDEALLIELHRRWSNHKIMTQWLSRFFHFLDRYHTPTYTLPSLEESSFLSFHDLVYEEMSKRITDAVLHMIDRKHAGENIDRALLNNVLALYIEIGGGPRKYHAKGKIGKGSAASSEDPKTSKVEKLDDCPVKSTKKVHLKSSDGDAFTVNYDAALMLESIKNKVESEASSSADNCTIPLNVSSKILMKVIQYCDKHVESSNSEDKTSSVDLEEWDAKFVEVDNARLFDLFLASNYLNIKSLLDLASQKVGDMMKGKTDEEIRKMFDTENHLTLLRKKQKNDLTRRKGGIS